MINMQSNQQQNKKKGKGCLWLIGINVFLWSFLILLLIFYKPQSPNTQTSSINQQPTKQVDYQQLLRDNTRTLNAGEYNFDDKFKDATYYKVKPINPKTSGNLMIYDENENLITNEVIGDGSYGIRECITILAHNYKISISGIDRVMFTPVITGGKKPVYENKLLVPGYHCVGHTVAPGKYTITPSQNSSGNLFVFRGNATQVNEILGGDYGVSSYCTELKDGDLIYTSGVYINLTIDKE